MRIVSNVNLPFNAQSRTRYCCHERIQFSGVKELKVFYATHGRKNVEC